jgi:hypothetical protein
MTNITQRATPAQSPEPSADLKAFISRVIAKIMLRSDHPIAEKFFEDIYSIADAAYSEFRDAGQLLELASQRERRREAGLSAWRTRQAQTARPRSAVIR